VASGFLLLQPPKTQIRPETLRHKDCDEMLALESEAVYSTG
jgi:hypothetical protein